MQILFYESSKSQEPHAASFGRKILSVVNNAITPLQYLLISKKQLLSHSGEKLFSCSQCSFSCTQAGNLKIHNRTHSGEKAFNCDQCNYSTAQSAHLSQHMRKHTGEKLLTNATILAYKLVISKITSRLIQEKSCLSVMNVIIEAVKLQG